MSTWFLTIFALVFIELMYFQPTFIDADEQVIQILEQNRFEREQLFESTVSLAFPWQHTIKSRQNQCLCNSVKSSFELFHPKEDLEWGPRHQGCKEWNLHRNQLCWCHKRKTVFFYTNLDTINIQRMWIQYMKPFQWQVFVWGWLDNILNLEILNLEIFAPFV